MADKRLTLAISSASPDPLGIAAVSGFYGQGACSGWYLTILASWYNLLGQPDAMRWPNMVAYLLATNWAAIDLFRQTSRYTNSSSHDDATKLLGSIAAATTITYWGLVHAISQFMLPQLYNHVKRESAFTSYTRPDWKFAALLVGSALPSMALTSLFTLNSQLWFAEQPSSHAVFGIAFEEALPVLYWDYIEADAHWLVLQAVPAVGLWSLLFTASQVLRISLQIFCSRTGRVSNFTQLLSVEWMVTVSFTIADVVFFFISGAMGFFSRGSLVFRILVSIPFIFVASAAFPFVLFIIWQIPMMYIFIVISRQVFSKESCFFMPCAPQAITEWDQAFPLLVGCVLFFFEIWPLVKRLARKLTVTSGF